MYSDLDPIAYEVHELYGVRNPLITKNWLTGIWTRTTTLLMVPPWVTHSLSDPLKLDGILKDHPATQLSNLLPKEFLPWCLTRRDLERSHFLLSSFNLLGGHLHIGSSAFEVDSDYIAVL